MPAVRRDLGALSFFYVGLAAESKGFRFAMEVPNLPGETGIGRKEKTREKFILDGSSAARFEIRVCRNSRLRLPHEVNVNKRMIYLLVRCYINMNYFQIRSVR